MNSILFYPSTKKQQKILTDLAHELGIGTKILNSEEIEDVILAEEIHKGEKTALLNYTDVKKELKTLRKKIS